jgi:hypothetical protein
VISPTLLGQRERLLRTTCLERVCIMCIRFLLHDVYRFESSQLSDMSNRLFVVVSMNIINGMMANVGLMDLMYLIIGLLTLFDLVKV